MVALCHRSGLSKGPVDVQAGRARPIDLLNSGCIGWRSVK